MSRDNEELKQLIMQGFSQMKQGFAQVNERLDRVEARLDRVEARLDGVEARLDGAEVRLGRIEMAQAEMRGELRGLSSWLASMDQRFVAIMRPYEPPHRAAE
ncbi:MAG: hypothetical protein ABT940_09415 [Alphaproteobacteria bacterium]